MNGDFDPRSLRGRGLGARCARAFGLGVVLWMGGGGSGTAAAPPPQAPVVRPNAKRATTVQPTAVQPTTVKRTAAKPATAKPTTAKPTTAKPVRASADPFLPASAAAKSDPFIRAANKDRAGSTRTSEIYGDRLDAMQREIGALKDSIFRGKVRLRLLRETVQRGASTGSRVLIAHRNQMGSGFRLVRVVFVLDGAQIYARTDETGTLDQEDELAIYDGTLAPGPHEVSVELTYQGHGYGVFAYLSGYSFETKSTHRFTALENAAVKLGSTGFERGNPGNDMADRPAVSWKDVPLDASGRPLPKRATPTGRPKSSPAN